ncbi:RICIN domain-containing protein [Kitasatospora purpeofusca]|uniref:RICIN domain-containing protein n=1 Tax=Kitasatospora purpeofusca TaxID=67352 RepID=UPI00225C3A92|nr:hypothetical protein [Kitasatospora purpeofusca]MCX4682808.1 hypothetical protein [Kitasatospora purpeofusca]
MDCTRLVLDGGAALGVDVPRWPLSHRVVMADSATGPNRAWRLIVNWDNGTFQIENVSLGGCLSGFRPLFPSDPTFLANCGGDSLDWYAHPTATGFMIRNAKYNVCLDAGEVHIPGNSQVLSTMSGCTGSRAQSWGNVPYGREANQPRTGGLRELALLYASKVCQSSPKKCSWDMEAESPAEMLPASCASVAWYNNGPKDLTHTFSLTSTKGWSHELGTEVELGMETGAISSMIAKVTVKVKTTFKKVWSGSQSVVNQMTGIVPPKHYGWVTLEIAVTRITGTWTFSLGDFPWTARDTVAMPVETAEDGRPTTYTFNAEPKAPVCR